MSPKDELELRDMVHTAVNYKKGPIAIRYPRGNSIGVSFTEKIMQIPIGQGEILKSDENPKIALVSIGPINYSCLEAKKILNSLDINCSVVNMRFVKPLDSNLIKELASKHDHIFTVEDNVKMGGFGSAILEFMNEQDLLGQTRLINLGIPDHFIEHGTQSELYQEIGLDPAGIANSVLQEISLEHRTIRSLQFIESTKTA